MKVVFVGGGNVAGALVGGLLARGHGREELCVVDPDAGQRTRISERFGVETQAPGGNALARAQVVVLAVKPQDIVGVASELAPFVGGALVLSVVAGIRITDLSRRLGAHQRVVRTMPNMPALIGRGITVLAAPEGLSDQDREAAQRIMGSVGETLWVKDEALLDAVTAVSGSGPGYVFYFMEVLERAAEELGFTSAQAQQLVLATFRGAAELAAGSDESPGQLRARVTSRGGTTAAALAVFEKERVGDAVAAAVHAACQRSIELGDEFGGDHPTT